jgi:hypothetical protein
LVRLVRLDHDHTLALVVLRADTRLWMCEY